MRLLLDTQALVWIVSGRRLKPRSNALYRETGNPVLVSAASYWEISIKIGLGKLKLDLDALDAELNLNRIGWLALEPRHFRRQLQLPPLHRDPFDRLLIAQALADDLVVVSGDAAFDAYGVSRIW